MRFKCLRGEGVSRTLCQHCLRLVLKECGDMGGGCKNLQKLRDVIYGWPLSL